MSSSRRLRIAAVEPYFGGSHQHFLLDLQKYSTHHIDLFTLPPRLWKWRVRGASLHLARALNEALEPQHAPLFDVLLCSDFVNLPDLRALVRPELRAVPVLYYMHENQIAYPLSPDEVFDPYFGFTNVLSCLSAEAVVFNSEFHKRTFLDSLPGFLPRLPDYEPRWVVETIAAKSEVIPVGLDVEELERLRPAAERARETGPRRVLWNHRWEFDKQPEVFFAALERLAGEGVPFVADVVGESFARQPEVFTTAHDRLGERLGHFGYVDSRQDYVQLLWNAVVVVSAARQEFFGISMAEAALCGAHPIAPDRLVYRDFYGGPCARQHLYRDEPELLVLLRRVLTAPAPSHDCRIAERLRVFDWHLVVPKFDSRFELLAGMAPLV